MDGRVSEILSQYLESSASDIDGSQEIMDIPGWDSLKHMKIITALEAEFSCEVPMDVLMDIVTVSDLRIALQKYSQDSA